MPSFRIVPAGDAALVVELPARIDPELNTWCVSLARELTRGLAATIRDVVIGYCSVTVYFDPLHVDAAWLEDDIRSRAVDLDVAPRTDGALIDVPVCYGGPLGPDLGDVAAFAGCSEEEAIDVHAGRDVPRLHGGIRSRLRIHGRGRSEDCGAATCISANRGAGGVGGHCRWSNGRLPDGDTRRLEHHRRHESPTVRPSPRGALSVQVR